MEEVSLTLFQLTSLLPGCSFFKGPAEQYSTPSLVGVRVGRGGLERLKVRVGVWVPVGFGLGFGLGISDLGSGWVRVGARIRVRAGFGCSG